MSDVEKNEKMMADILKMKNFKEWRTSAIKYFNELCHKVQNSDLKERADLVESIQFVPKCLVHFTKKLCHCDRDCVFESFNSDEFDQSCYIFDLRDLLFNTKHLDCKYIGLKVVEGKLMRPEQESLNFNTRNEIFNKITNLCKDKNYDVSKLQCSFYDLKEICKNEYDCYDYWLNEDMPKNCVNPDFKDQMKDIENSIGLDTLNFYFFEEDRQHLPNSPEALRAPKGDSISFGNYLAYNEPGINNSGITLSPNLIAPILALSVLMVPIYRMYKNGGNKGLLCSLLGLLIMFGCAISCLNY